MSEPLFEATTLAIQDGPNAAVRALARKAELEGVQYQHVRDGEGRELATVRRLDYLSGVSKLLGAFFSLAWGGGGTVSKQRVLGAAGDELFTLEITGSAVIVKDPTGQPIAMLANQSRGGGKVVDLRLYGPPRGKRYAFRRPGPPLLVVNEPQPIAPFDWAIKTESGATVARVANANDGRNVVTVLGNLDQQQRRILCAFACSMIERRWTAIPASPPKGG